MKTLYRFITVHAILLIAVTADEANEQSNKMLRDALFAEEANQDYKTATEKYQTLIANFDKECQIAVTALYRLAEIHRKQGNKTEAATLYKRIVNEFPSMETHVTLSRENLLALGEKSPKQPLIYVGAESRELTRLKKLEVTSPDLFKLTENLENAARNNKLLIIAYLLEKNPDINQSSALAIAAQHGHLAACKILLDAGFDPNWDNGLAVERAFVAGHTEVLKLLFKRGADVKGKKGSWLPSRIRRNTPLSLIKLIIDAGYDVNTASPIRVSMSVSGSFVSAGTGLLQHALDISHNDLVDYLFEKKVNVNLASPETGLTPLHIAASIGDSANVRRLIKAGANVNSRLKVELKQNWSNKICKQATPLGVIIFHLYKHPYRLKSEHLACLKILLENKAELPNNIIATMIDRNQVDLLKLFVQYGADPRVKNDRGYSHLSTALATGRLECALYLLNHGVTLHPDYFHLLEGSKNTRRLTAKTRSTLMEKQLYPEFAKRKGITLALPEMLWDRELAPSSTSTPEIASQIYKQGLPEHFTYFDENRKKNTIRLRDCDLVQCSLIRQGERIQFKLTDKKWPSFISGDIIELKQFKTSKERLKIPLKDRIDKAVYVPSTNKKSVFSPQIKKMLNKHLPREAKPRRAPNKK